MPDFRVIASATDGTPGTPLEARVFADPASPSRPSRFVGVNDRQFRFLRAPAGTVRLTAIMNDVLVPEDDSVVGLFTAWAVEFSTISPPGKSYPDPLKSSVVDFALPNVGHYLLAMRHEDVGVGAKSNAGGVVLIHLDVTAT